MAVFRTLTQVSPRWMYWICCSWYGYRTSEFNVRRTVVCGTLRRDGYMNFDAPCQKYFPPSYTFRLSRRSACDDTLGNVPLPHNGDGTATADPSSRESSSAFLNSSMSVPVTEPTECMSEYPSLLNVNGIFPIQFPTTVPMSHNTYVQFATW